MARVNTPDVQPFYAAAQRLIEAALRSDDSLFTPERPIWSLPTIDALYRDFVEHPDTSSGSFVNKFHGQLANSAPETIQLAAELRYIYLLPANRIRPDTKRRQAKTVLGWSPQSAVIPPDLDQALEHGIARARRR
jgi:5-methylcytosine-specific restriction protein B